MGAAWMPIRQYLDNIIEVVCIKSGLLLSYDEIRTILNEKFHDDGYFTVTDMNVVFRIRSEEFDAHVSFVRYRIGNLKNDTNGVYLFSTRLIKWLKKGYDPMKAMKIVATASSQFRNQSIDPRIIINKIMESGEFPYEMAVDIVMAVAEAQFQSSDIYPSQAQEWEVGVPLGNLFKCEIKADSERAYLPQSILDYLAVNQSKIETIHWRNFERFCADFFQRVGYHVQLGPGSNDGGIDIRAFDMSNSQNPKLAIQCKRNSRDNKVKIDVVKAFYTDVSFENAEHGIIITTSYIEPGGKKVSNARNYPLSFIENEQVKKIAQSMWRYH